MLKIGNSLITLEAFKHRPRVPQKSRHKPRWRMDENPRGKADRRSRRGPRPPMVRRNGLPFCVYGDEPFYCERGPITIYALVDPRDNTVRYVGKTSSPRDRLTQHIERESKGRKGKWVVELKAAGAVPRMEILERVPVAEWEEAERRWIAFYSTRGSVLNVEIGGRGYLHRYNLKQRARPKIQKIISKDTTPTALPSRPERLPGPRGWNEFLMGS